MLGINKWNKNRHTDYSKKLLLGVITMFFEKTLWQSYCTKIFRRILMLFIAFISYAHAEVVWLSDATILSTASANFAQASINSSNQTTVIWIEGTDIKFSNFTPTTGWSAAATAVSAGAAVTNPLISLNNLGQTIITWTEGITALKFATRSTFSGTWTAAGTISTGSVDISIPPTLDFNNNGQAVAAWVLIGGTVRSSTLAFGGSWVGPIDVGGETTSFRVPVVINDAGQVFAGIVRANSQIMSRSQTFTNLNTGSAGYILHQISQPNVKTSIPTQLAINASSGLIAGWVIANEIMNVSRFAPGAGSWSIDTGRPKMDANLVTSFTGDYNDSNLAMLAWTERSGSLYFVKVAMKTIFGSNPNWEVRTFATSSNVLSNIHLILDNRGEGIVAWDESVGGSGVVKASSVHFRTGNAFVNLTISDTSKDATLQDIAENDVKEFVMVWRTASTPAIVARVGKIVIAPPSNPRGKQTTNHFLTQTEFINQLMWDPSLSPSVTAYKILANGFEIGLISTNKFKHRTQKKGLPVIYTISSVNSTGEESVSKVQITVP